MTAGHNALRGSGPGQNLAFENAVAHVGCPDRRIDRLCITCCSPSQPSHHAMVLGAISLDPQPGRIIVSLAPSHHRPGHSRKLVGQRDGSDFGRPSCQQRCDPRAILGAMELGITDDGECAGHEQAAQIAVPLFADTAKPIPTPTRLLSGYQANLGREVTTRSKDFRVANARNQSGGQQRTDAWNAIEALARWIGAVPCEDHSIKI